MEIWQAFILGLIIVAVMVFADTRRNKAFKNYLERKRGKR